MSESAVAKSKDAPRREGRLRENISAFTIAIAVTVLFKFFVIEAYQIPTSSMQPTLMGSKEAGVYDRLLVDKRYYELHEPERWDVVVFRYPIRHLQNYVKRLVGVGGDRLRIGGGNVYALADGTDGTRAEDREVLRKPELVQQGLWRELYPAGLELLGGSPDDFLSFTPVSAWEVEGEDTLRLKRETNFARLTYGTATRSDPGGATYPDLERRLVNAVWHGYPTNVARAIKESMQGALTTTGRVEYVRDVRFAARLEPSGAIEEIRFELETREIGDRVVVYAFEIRDGEGRILATADRDESLTSDPFPVAVRAGDAVHLTFEHRDDRCRALVDGRVAGELDTGPFSSLTPIEVAEDTGTIARLELRKADPLTLSGLTVERDLHYLPSSRTGVIEVPDGHFFMMGDNTQQSVDSRDWTEVVVAVDDEGRALDPRTAPESMRRLRGNFRPRAVGQPVDADENPVPVVTLDRVTFTDHVGENWVLAAPVSQDAPGKRWGSGDGVWFVDAEGEPWQAPEAPNAFVPREHVLGRPLLVFWPWYRAGVVR